MSNFTKDDEKMLTEAFEKYGHEKLKSWLQIQKIRNDLTTHIYGDECNFDGECDCQCEKCWVWQCPRGCVIYSDDEEEE